MKTKNNKRKYFIILGIIVVLIIVALLALMSVRSYVRTNFNDYSGAYNEETGAPGVSSSSSNALVPMAQMLDSGSEGAVKPKQSSTSLPGGGGKAEDSNEGRMIIRNGTLSVITKDVRKSVQEASSYAVSNGGFVVNSNITGNAEAPSADLTVRIPVEKFEAALGAMKNIGIRVTSEYVTGEDVTEQFVDTQARLKNLKASEEQFQAIMKQAQKVSDILEVQQQLERVRGEIEVAQGRADYLQKSAKLATITVYFATDAGELPVVDPAEKWNPLTITKNAFRALLGFMKFIGNIIIWLIVFIPLWIIVALVVWLIKYIKKRRANR